MKKIIGVLLLACVVTFAFGAIATAQGETPPTKFFKGKIPENVTTGAQFLELFVTITNWIFVIVLLFAVIMIVLAGWQFISGGGDTQAVSQAKNKLLYAAIGIGVALLARAIPAAVTNIIGA